MHCVDLKINYKNVFVEFFNYRVFTLQKKKTNATMLPLPPFDYDDQMTNNFNNFRNLKALNHKTTSVMGAGRAKVNKKCTERDKDVHIVKEWQT